VRASADWDKIPAFGLDTSALLAYLLDEPGSVDLEPLKKKARLSFAALCEMHCVISRKKDEAAADRCYGLVKSLGFPVLHSTDEIIVAASRLKTRYGLGLGDAFVAATSLCERMPLLTYDADFLPLAREIRILGLK
jgi:PIN domain nuclease of toxin-antitoxin system